MKMIKVSDEFYNAAKRLASYVDGCDLEYNSYLAFIKNTKNNPKDHIYYQAAIVGEWFHTLPYSKVIKTEI